MSHLGDKLGGKVKENVGWAIGNKNMETRGKAQATEANAAHHGQRTHEQQSTTTDPSRVQQQGGTMGSTNEPSRVQQQGGNMMGSSNEPGRIHGNMEAAKGTTKQYAGQATGNRGMEARGEAQLTAGQSEAQSAKDMHQAKGREEQMTGATKEYTGQALGNEQMQTEGQGRRLYGEGRENLHS